MHTDLLGIVVMSKLSLFALLLGEGFEAYPHQKTSLDCLLLESGSLESSHTTFTDSHIPTSIDHEDMCARQVRELSGGFFNFSAHGHEEMKSCASST